MELENVDWDNPNGAGGPGVAPGAGDTHLADTAPGAPPLSSCWNDGKGRERGRDGAGGVWV